MSSRDIAVIVPAAGASTRFGGPKNKLAEELCGRPVLTRTLDAFLVRPDVERIVLPTSQAIDWLPADPRIQTCPGGTNRAQSVWNALRQIPAGIEWVAVHDGARPLVSQDLIDRSIATARQHGAAVPAMPVHLTVKEARGPLPAQVVRTVPRANLWAMQTPQVMRRADLLDAFDRCPIPLDQVTDDVQLLELVGKEVWLVAGEERNLKITTRMDLRVAGMWLEDDASRG
jgi:2-C-methyl-D-erythritol 4-phosphate cytidylyltransferase